MNPAKADRERLVFLTDLPNVGEATAEDFRLLGFTEPRQLAGSDPLDLYRRLCVLKGKRQDPCVLDVFLSVLSFLRGEDPKPWWGFTERRKMLLEKERKGGSTDFP
ncbi:MAG: helix-hairpin-helix domain-containing protein [Aminivibrio sp.]|nr:helix-hairpin-helix domain-containing protein [Aminivibrio sp.]